MKAVHQKYAVLAGAVKKGLISMDGLASVWCRDCGGTGKYRGTMMPCPCKMLYKNSREQQKRN